MSSVQYWQFLRIGPGQYWRDVRCAWGSHWWNSFGLNSYILHTTLNFTAVWFFFKRTSQTSLPFDLELHFCNESRDSNFIHWTMEEIEYDACRYSYTLVIVFGILRNILDILSILGQKKNALKNSYYFIVLHLPICDLAVLIFYLFVAVQGFWLEEPLSVHSSIFNSQEWVWCWSSHYFVIVLLCIH